MDSRGTGPRVAARVTSDGVAGGREPRTATRRGPTCMRPLCRRTAGPEVEAEPGRVVDRRVPAHLRRYLGALAHHPTAVLLHLAQRLLQGVALVAVGVDGEDDVQVPPAGLALGAGQAADHLAVDFDHLVP